MTGFHKALYTFWSGFSSGGNPIPAYLSGHVPPKTPFPYITFEVVEGDFLSGNILTAFGWFKAESGGNVNADAADFLDSVEAAIPQEGTVLPVGEGYAFSALAPSTRGWNLKAARGILRNLCCAPPTAAAR